jgi:hypothetical protein
MSGQPRHRCSLADLPEAQLQRIAELLDRNTVAVGLRLTCRYFAGLFSDYTTVQLDQPVPEGAFAEHFNMPGVMHSLSLRRRHKLMCTLAKAGDVANLRLLIVSPDGTGEAGLAGCTLADQVFEAAACAGQLPACRLLHELGCPGGLQAAQAAARMGHVEVFNWLRDAGYARLANERRLVVECAAFGGYTAIVEQVLGGKGLCDADPLFDAARSGHATAFRWLLARWEGQRLQECVSQLLRGVAYGCDLAFLQVRKACARDSSARLLFLVVVLNVATFGASVVLQEMAQRFPLSALGLHDKSAVATEAALSPTPDWRAKVEWLQAEGCRVRSGTNLEALISWLAAWPRRPNAADMTGAALVARLTWLKGLGFQRSHSTVEWLFHVGDEPEVSGYVISE